MNILIATDADLTQQINGVVRTLKTTIEILKQDGHRVRVIQPSIWNTYPLPHYPEIQFPLRTPKLKMLIEEFRPDAIHIATEFLIGYKVRKWCIKNKFDFTTAYHTNFPQYLDTYFNIPENLTYKYLRYFHGKSKAVMVATNSMKELLAENGINNTEIWGRGVDTDIFHHKRKQFNNDLNLSGPVFLNVGRVCKEKNLEEFLKLDLPGTKVLVGDGPMLETYKEKYPDVLYLGALQGDALGEIYAQASVFVFPSLSDTFGLVMAEAISSGVPVAAFPVIGPKDVVTQGVTGILSMDLKQACMEALDLHSSTVLKGADFSWRKATDQFFNNLHPRKKDF